GVACDQCGTVLPGNPVAATLSDASGRFHLDSVPPGTNVPLVIQIGKWRRPITIASVPACADTPVPASLTRLPRNETEGNIPRIAVTTGSSGALECLLREIGIADTEFTSDLGTGRVHLYRGGESAGSNVGAGAVSFSAALGGAALS